MTVQCNVRIRLALLAGFEAWLDPHNFDAKGAQKRSLGESIVDRS